MRPLWDLVSWWQYRTYHEEAGAYVDDTADEALD